VEISEIILEPVRLASRGHESRLQALGHAGDLVPGCFLAAFKAEPIAERDATRVYLIPTLGTFGPFIQQGSLLFSSCATIIAKSGGQVKKKATTS